jgi:hypothetical protein
MPVPRIYCGAECRFFACRSVFFFSVACGLCKIFVKRLDVAVKNILVVVSHMEKFYSVLVAACIIGTVDDFSHHIYQLILQAQGYHDLLSRGERDVGFHEDTALADVEGPSHGVFPLPALIINDQVVKEV